MKTAKEIVEDLRRNYVEFGSKDISKPITKKECTALLWNLFYGDKYKSVLSYEKFKEVYDEIHRNM